MEVAMRRAIKVARRERLLRLRNAPRVNRLHERGLALSDERKSALKEAFDTLPTRLRATTVLRLHTGLSEEETAEALGCSVGTVKSNLHDARKRLTQLLSEAGHAPTLELRKEKSDDQS
jgi:RNA polymerase sigma factor (sigma-70 family)